MTNENILSALELKEVIGDAVFKVLISDKKNNKNVMSDWLGFGLDQVERMMSELSVDDQEENEREIGEPTFFCLRLCPLEQMLMPSRVWGEGLPAIKS